MNGIVQGETQLIPVVSLPDGLKERRDTKFLLGIGETGNAHVLTAERVDWLFDAIEDINEIALQGAAFAKRDVYVRVGEGGQISHRATDEPHGALDVPQGLYLVRIKREAMPFENEARFVAD